MALPEVYRITDYGGGFSDSAAGGSGVEYYAVSGLGPSEFEAAHALGLPRRGQFSVDNRLAFAGTVQAVDRVAEMPPSLWIARVRYSVGGTFNFGTSLGTRLRSSGSYTLPIPVLTQIAQQENGLPIYGWPIASEMETFERQVYTLVESVRSTVSMAQIRKYLQKNTGKVYLREDAYYYLRGATAVKDSGNNIRIDTEFYSFSEVESTPVGTRAGQDVLIPSLNTLQDRWSWDSTGNIRGVSPPLAEGEPLPWL